MRREKRQLETVRTWYGLRGEIDVGSGFWHLVRVGRISLPHPALVNIFLRAGLSGTDQDRLSLDHEFGHLQTFPLAILHALGWWRWRTLSRNWLSALVVHQALWELAAEAWVMVHQGRRYFSIYLGRLWRPLAFWIGILTTMVLLIRRRVSRNQY